METIVYIDGINRSGVATFGSLSIRDQINEGTDTCSFSVKKYGTQTFSPTVNQEVTITYGGDRIFGGVIVEVEQELDGHSTIVYSVQCKDYTQYLDRKLVTERYQTTNIRAVILDLVDRYADDYGFTADLNVMGEDVSVKSVSFSQIPLSQCFTKLAQLTGYYWYVDYYKDIHFIKKNTELAPFNITDTSANYIFDSLIVANDLSKIRNSVKVNGGEAISDARTELLAGDGEKDTFPLANKFSDLPTVTVEGVVQDVGVDYLQLPDDYDVMWNFSQKYLKFNPGSIPALPVSGETNIEVYGTPLKPIVVKRVNTPSVAEYGLYEYVINKDTIKSRDEALQFAQSELQSYADKLRSGSFQTYTEGLRSGQTITVMSTLRDISDTFVIQSVRFKQVNNELGFWHVEIATAKTLSIIDTLQKLLLQERISFGEGETLLNFFQLDDGFAMTDSIGTPVATTTQDYYWEQGDPGSDSEPSPIIWNKFTWA